MKLIGDVHGKFEKYKKILREHTDTIQVGDMGIGFRRYPHGNFTQNPPFDYMIDANGRFIRGNHDNPASCRAHKQFIPDGSVENDVMFIGGASSIDWQYRIEGYSWWKDEELSDDEMKNINDIYIVTKPRVLITHDVAMEAIQYIPHTHHFLDRSRTQLFLQSLWEQHQPEMWVHGHHHLTYENTCNGTKFIGLAELEVKEL